MNTVPTVRILVGYHKPAPLLESDILTPIHLGRDVAMESSKDGALSEEEYQWMLDNMIGDNTGDNISCKGRSLNELTGYYWAWKNYGALGNPDYIGFMHYRRHLCFDLNSPLKANGGGVIPWSRLDDEYIRTFHLTDEQIVDVVKDYDIVTGEKVDVKYAKRTSVYDHYKQAKYHHIGDYDIALKVMEGLFPQYAGAAKRYNAQKCAYFHHMFVMRRELFHEYVEWLFSILFETEKLLDTSFYNVHEMRALALIGEMLFGTWYTHVRETGRVRFLELMKTLVDDVSCNALPSLRPFFQKNNVAICFSANQAYLPYLAVTLKSLIEHVSDGNNYDICVLHNDLSCEAQTQIKQMEQGNVSIRFVNLAGFYKTVPDSLRTPTRYSINALGRFFIPHILRDYSKVLYIDCDIIVNKDVAELFHIELGETYLLAAVRDRGLSLLSNISETIRSYLRDKVKLDSAKSYFNSGVLLLNTRQMRREGVTEQLVKALDALTPLRFIDQDVLNFVCKGRVHYLDIRWNVESSITLHVKDWSEKMAHSDLYEYLESREDPWIIHYCGAKKPWNGSHTDPLSAYFWMYARKTEFYEKIVFDYCEKIIMRHICDESGDEENKQHQKDGELRGILRSMKRLPSLKRKLKRIRFRLLYTFGAKRGKLKMRKAELKRQIRNARAMIQKL